MKRLREIEDGSPLIAKARQLIESMPEVNDSPAHVARMRTQLDRPRGAWFALRKLSAAALATLVVLFGASAFAAVRYIAAYVAPAPPESAVQAASARASRASRASHLLQQGRAQPATSPDAPSATPPSAAPPSDAEPQSAQAHAPKGRSHASAAHAGLTQREQAARVRGASQSQAQSQAQASNAQDEPLEAADEAESESALVHRAVRALRRDADAALAAKLLAHSQRRYPSGPLAEEALSLQIEAALALRDATRARSFARQYLARYPHGRYSDVAQRALRAVTSEPASEDAVQ